MGDLSRWDILLLVVAAYVAVMTLVKLMTARRDQLVKQVQEQIKTERERRRQELKRQQQLEQQQRDAA